ncbi:hypothetical protein J3R30DRAFT_2755030 [Lentinula aciculospora]|uniref:Uncharacterized protein n=1 Tax=Lentinula aciculospora TaxID=153920 RepID=A0A9W9AD66_9AGAR|nr:hypothetical protein J3R30DRAFT_2755030 [Lentinula aciculospora]
MIGGIVGGIVILILLVIASCFFCRRRKYRNRSINFVPYLNLDGDKPPRASIAHDAEAPQSPIFDPMAMVAPSSHATTPDQRSAVTRTPIPFHDLLNDQNVTIKRTASFSRLSRNSYPRSSFSSQFTGAKSSRYSSSSSSSFITASDGDSVASTVKVGELIDPFADPDPRAEDPFVDSFGLQRAIFIDKAYRIPPPPPSRLQPTKPTITDESTRLSQTSVGSSHCGVAM